MAFRNFTLFCFNKTLFNAVWFLFFYQEELLLLLLLLLQTSFLALNIVYFFAQTENIPFRWEIAINLLLFAYHLKILPFSLFNGMLFNLIKKSYAIWFLFFYQEDTLLLLRVPFFGF